jgi:hypothetical protein
VVTNAAAEVISGLLSGTTNLNVYDNKQKIIIYPNPATNILNIKISQPVDSAVELEIINTAGAIAYKISYADLPAGDLVLPVNGFSSGLYYLRLTTQEGSDVYKLVIR